MDNRPRPFACVFAAVTLLSWNCLADESLRAVKDLDGIHLTVGPLASAVRIEDEWTPAAGVELSVVNVQEHCRPAAFGFAFGGLSYTDRDGGRLWFEIEAALKDPLPVAIGLGVGMTAEVDPVRDARLGAQATLWVFAGVIPYLRAGTLDLEGEFIEAGVMLKIPALRY